MRYTFAMLLTLVLGVAAVIQPAFAAEHEGPQVPVSTVVAQYQPADPGSVAGPATPLYPTQIIEHDRN